MTHITLRSRSANAPGVGGSSPCEVRLPKEPKELSRARSVESELEAFRFKLRSSDAGAELASGDIMV